MSKQSTSRNQAAGKTPLKVSNNNSKSALLVLSLRFPAAIKSLSHFIPLGLFVIIAGVTDASVLPPTEGLVSLMSLLAGAGRMCRSSSTPTITVMYLLNAVSPEVQTTFSGRDTPKADRGDPLCQESITRNREDNAEHLGPFGDILQTNGFFQWSSRVSWFE